MRYAGELAALGTAGCFGSASNLFAAAGRRMGSHKLNRLRITTAWMFLTIALWSLQRVWWPGSVTPTALVALSISGMVGFVFGDSWGFRSIVILGPGRASLLAATTPLFTTALAWPILQQRPGPLACLGMLLNFGGVAFAITSRSRREAARAGQREGSERMGILSGLLGAFGQSGGIILSKIGLRTGLDPLSATVVRIAAATVTVWLLTVARRQVRPTLASLGDGRGTAFMAAGALMGPVLGVTLALTSLDYIEAGVATSITALSPLVAMLLAARFHGERLSWRPFAGALLAIAGVVILFHR